MPRISYYGIAAKIMDVLRNDPDVAETAKQITLMEDQPRAAEMMPWIGIYPINRASPPNQPIAAGSRHRFNVNYEIWVYAFSINGVEDAFLHAEDLLGMVEVALMKHPTLDGMVDFISLTGGDFDNARTDAAFVMGGSVQLTVSKLASTR